MFPSLKKPAAPFDLAAYIAMRSSDHLAGIEDKVAKSLARTSSPNLPQGKTLDEIQWVPVACGVIAARICFGVESANQVTQELGHVYGRIHETNERRTLFSEQFIGELQVKIRAYLRAFESGLGINAVRLKGTADPIDLALKRVAAVGHDLVRGLPLADIATSELPDELLSKVVYELARQSTRSFREHFENFRIS